MHLTKNLNSYLAAISKACQGFGMLLGMKIEYPNQEIAI